jgi:hypothetical protein
MSHALDLSRFRAARGAGSSRIPFEGDATFLAVCFPLYQLHRSMLSACG